MLTRWWLRLFGVACMAIGLVHLVVGPASVIGGGPVNATIDGEMRFYSVLFIGFGAGFVWAAADLPQRLTLVHVLGGLFFFGGLARLLAILQTGAPHVFFLAMIAVEVVVPVVNWRLLKHIR
ncbi:DUF4345 domain-containing protein [Mycobacterium sp. PDNC021]|uniref:DUF4345 domain-containing protein n=1 Tax=Mycobacterium sp. PDNC021 TaxID=3391399 RepID=UPI003AACF55A